VKPTLPGAGRRVGDEEYLVGDYNRSRIYQIARKAFSTTRNHYWTKRYAQGRTPAKVQVNNNG
jgi:hypothetical protein